MQFGPRELLMIAAALAVPVLSYLLIFMPQQNRVDEMRSQIGHRKQMLDALRIETARYTDLERANAEISQRIQELEGRLPSNKEVDQIVRQVSLLAIQSGLKAPGLRSEKPLSAAMYREQPLKLSTRGSFDGFYSFLLELERLPRITRVPDMVLEQEDAETGEMSAEFTLSIYFSDEEGA